MDRRLPPPPRRLARRPSIPSLVWTGADSSSLLEALPLPVLRRGGRSFTTRGRETLKTEPLP